MDPGLLILPLPGFHQIHCYGGMFALRHTGSIHISNLTLMSQAEPVGNPDSIPNAEKNSRIAVVHTWLRQCSSAASNESQLPDDLIEPYAVLLCGYAKAAVSRMEVFLQRHPSSLYAAILLAGAQHASEADSSSLPIQFSSHDPEHREDLRPKVLACLSSLSHPLLERSKLVGSIGAALSRPTAAMMLSYYARIFKDFDAFDGAITCLAHGIEIWPEIPDLYLDLFTLLMDTLQYVPAMELMLNAQRRFPLHPRILRALGLVYRSQGMPEEALLWCSKLYHLDPANFPDAIVYRCFVPAVCATPEEASRYRRRMLRGLRVLKGQCFNSMETFRGLWQIPSFSLAYQDVNNRRLLENQAAVFRRAYHPFLDKFSTPPHFAVRQKKGKVRIAFISEFFRTHTNAFAFEGLIKHLDKERFHTIILHNHDSSRDSMRDRIDSYGHESIVLPKRLDLAAEIICKLDLDVLFYTDIGMSPSLYLLALARLASLQVTGWGIPHTSGINTIDVYISTSLAEPATAARHYTEELCLVSRLPCCYLRENLPKLTLPRSYFFLPEGVFIFACLQQLHKLHPDFDELLEELALRNPEALFVFAEHHRPLLTHRVLERWKCRAPTMLKQSRLFAHMERKEFAALCGCVDLLLDPPYYGSGITFYESAHTGTPTLSLQGRFLRSRFVAGAYEMLGLEGPPVAKSKNDYLSLGTELAGDVNRLRRLKTYLAEQAEAYLYDDTLYVRQVENIIFTKIR